MAFCQILQGRIVRLPNSATKNLVKRPIRDVKVKSGGNVGLGGEHWDDAVEAEAVGDGYEGEGAAEKGSHDVADDFQALEPLVIVPAEVAEGTPETMSQMEPENHKPDNVKSTDPDIAESFQKQAIRIRFNGAAGEELVLHVKPEIVEVEPEAYDDQKAENDHVLGGPGIGFGLASACISFEAQAAAGLEVLDVDDNGVDDVDDEPECKDGNHEAYDRSPHEFAGGIETVLAEYGNGIDDGVKRQEENHKQSGQAHDELFTD